MNGVQNLSMSRREFLGTGAGALVLGFTLPACSRRAELSAEGGAMNAFISIAGDGRVTIRTPFIEMGQGTYTSIPMLFAEEMDIDMDSVRVEQAPHGPNYKVLFNDTMRFTGGSLSVRSGFERFRQVGATVRAMLMEAAATHWRVPVSELSTEPGYVVHARKDRRLPYGKLAALARTLEPPANVRLKNPGDFRLLGTSVPRTDAAEKSDGRAQFGIDFQRDGLLTAVVRQSPVFFAELKNVDKDAALQMPGVEAVEPVPNGIAAVADNYWHAKRAVDALSPEFDAGPHPEFSSDDYLERLRSRVDEKGIVAEEEGDVEIAFASAAKTVEAEYHTPFLAHATMEPMNCAALVKDGRCTVWAPNQGVDFVAGAAAQVTGLPLDAIDVRTPYLGGGFGRRFIPDYAIQAVTLANALQGRPIKVVWPREEDTQHDWYRPMTAAKYRAGLDDGGMLVALRVTTVGDGPNRRHAPQPMADTDLDESVVEGLLDQPYEIPNRRLEYVFEYAPPPIGYWRSVGNSHNAFFKESFIDEIAHATGQDPVEFRRRLLEKRPRVRKVLDTVAAMASWRATPWYGRDGRKRAMGVALHPAYDSIAAQVAEVSLDDAGRTQVHRVWCVVDCGFAVNPLNVTMQAESAIAYGLSAALMEQVRMEKGRAVNGNFDDYPILTAQRMPEVEVEIVNSGEKIGGIGELCTPPIAPAICNALHTLTGQRIRSLPVDSHRLS